MTRARPRRSKLAALTLVDLSRLRAYAATDLDAARVQYISRRNEIIEAMRGARAHSTTAAELVLQFETRADVRAEAAVARSAAIEERQRILRDGGAGR